MKRGIAVVTFNQRTVEEILQMVRIVGGLVGCQGRSEQLADRLAANLDRIGESAARFPRRLRVFFEEWDDPLISGIRWVEELVAIAGGDPIFPELADARLARSRIVKPSEVVRAFARFMRFFARSMVYRPSMTASKGGVPNLNAGHGEPGAR